MLNQWFLIGALALVTYLSRVIGLEFMSRWKMNPTLRLYFNYVPIAIIAALLVKQIVLPFHGGLTLSIPVLLSCIGTAVMILLTKRFLPSVIVGVVIGVLFRYFFS
ncbi:AzlD domain-containing protein [Sporolactobacillus sp. STSJ-5]|uniref:AzlD domain-containing protein n=1 Tax=Sporolactobacillus sp. STSJ-5 TaxID=2965076 RepID=UPI0021085EF2|nr:AzlD domain-containing protein [Sporolactobacillus sp. STSJ-5]MCQ2010229.1 AzlD domain-containing protein [Sporolactobacillus sp. STSJ-5]